METNIYHVLIIVIFILITLNYSLSLKNKNSILTKSYLSYIQIPTGLMQATYNCTSNIIQPKQSVLKDVKFIVVTNPTYTGTHTISNKIGSVLGQNDILTTTSIENVSGKINEYTANLNEGLTTGIYLNNRPAFNNKRQIYPQIEFSSPGSDTITSPGLYCVEVEIETLNFPPPGDSTGCLII